MIPKPYLSHTTLELNPLIIESDFLETVIESVLAESKCTIVAKFCHAFNPIGKTISFILAESACVIHTYSEFKRITVCLETCNPEIDHAKFSELLNLRLEGKIVKYSCTDLASVLVD